MQEGSSEVSDALHKLNSHSPIYDNPIPECEIDLFMVDCNFGCNKTGSRYDTRWETPQFEGCFANMKEANTSSAWSAVVFLHDNQIEVSTLQNCDTIECFSDLYMSDLSEGVAQGDGRLCGW